MRLAVALAIALTAMSCTPLPESYPVPEQRAAADGPDPEPLRGFVSMDDPRAPDYILGDFLEAPPGQLWRWTGPRPAVRLRTDSAEKLTLRVRLTFPEHSHGPLMPIPVRFLINEKLLERVEFKKPGEIDYRKDIPKEWILTNQDNHVRCEIEKVYVAAADGAKLGMIISEIGFERRK
jgi:hypothetical protein